MYARPAVKQVALACALALLAGALAPPAHRAAAQGGCTVVYGPRDGWQVEACASDPNVPAWMEVVVDGRALGRAAFLRVAHRSASGDWPEVAVLYASGYVRLKQNADPRPAIPFGSPQHTDFFAMSGGAIAHSRHLADSSFLPSLSLFRGVPLRSSTGS